MNIKPFFTFYGGKWRAAPMYDRPEHKTIVEPFAGSAGYSIRYPWHDVVLVERDPLIAATWRYLIRVAPGEIRSLPDIEVGQTTDDLNVAPEARLLIGWWCNGGSATPKKSLGFWARERKEAGGAGWKTAGQLNWGARVRERIASQLDAIRHWRIIEGDYTMAPDVEATWFIDPPYVEAGKHYRFGSSSLDYPALGAWCKRRFGQVIVCENVGATWLPFRPWRDIQANGGVGFKASKEAIWP
jgi:hypothetical protein